MAPKVVQLSYEQWLIDLAGGAPPSPQMHQMYLTFVQGQGYAPKYEAGAPPTEGALLGGAGGHAAETIAADTGANLTPSVLDQFQEIPYGSQWLQRLQEQGIAGQGLFGANPAETYARNLSGQRSRQFELARLAGGEGSPLTFMNWEPGANMAQNRQAALANWQTLAGGGGQGTEWAQLGAPETRYQAEQAFGYAGAARQGSMPPFMRRLMEQQFNPMFNQWQQQGAQGGANSWTQYLAGQYGL